MFARCSSSAKQTCCSQNKKTMGEVEVLYVEENGNVAKRVKMDPRYAFKSLQQQFTENDEIISKDGNEIGGNVYEENELSDNDDYTFYENIDEYQGHQPAGRQGHLVWCSKRRTAADDEATKYFLQLRGTADMKKRFADKRVAKKTLWQELARKMEEGDNAAEKCRQKYANLKNRYFNHCKHLTRTGEGRREAPPYYALMHNILGDKAKANPVYLIDTERENDINGNNNNNDAVVNRYEDDEENENVDEQETIQQHAQRGRNRFQGMKTRIRGKSNTEKILEAIHHVAEENRREQRTQFERLEQLLQVQNEQRNRLLNILEQKR